MVFYYQERTINYYINEPQLLRLVGQFKIGEEFDINDIATLPGCNLYKCKILDENTDIKPTNYMLVTESSILLYKGIEKKKGRGMLVLAASLYNLSEINKGKSNEKEVTLVWKDIEQNGRKKDTFHIENTKELINNIVENCKKIGIASNINSMLQYSIEEMIEMINLLEIDIKKEKTQQKLEKYTSALSKVLQSLGDRALFMLREQRK